MGRGPALVSWLDHVAAGEAFAAEDFILAAPATFPHVQLFNPVGSGKRIRLRSVHAISGGIIQANIRRYDPPGAILGPPAPFVIENLLGGGPAAVAELRHDNIVVLSGSPFWLLRSSANIPCIYPARGLEWGHDLLEGQGILLSGTLFMTMIVNWQWVELPL